VSTNYKHGDGAKHKGISRKFNVDGNCVNGYDLINYIIVNLSFF